MIARRTITIPDASPIPASIPAGVEPDERNRVAEGEESEEESEEDGRATVGDGEPVEGDRIVVAGEFEEDGRLTAAEKEDGSVSDVVVNSLVDVAIEPFVEVDWDSPP